MKRGLKVRPAHLLVCVLSLPLLLLVVVMCWPQRQASGLAVTFLRFTNAPGRPPSAVFGVTNLSGRGIVFAIPDPQIRSNGVWADVTVVPQLGTDLAGGEGTNITVALPSGGQTWRMPILWAYRMSRREIYIYRFKSLLRTAQEGSLAGWNYSPSGDGYTNVSAEMGWTKAEP
jgi:hypothetical protein